MSKFKIGDTVRFKHFPNNQYIVFKVYNNSVYLTDSNGVSNYTSSIEYLELCEPIKLNNIPVCECGKEKFGFANCVYWCPMYKAS